MKVENSPILQKPQFLERITRILICRQEAEYPVLRLDVEFVEERGNCLGGLRRKSGSVGGKEGGGEVPG